ncbi:MAG TPA: cytochrome P450 [Kofleriaceae bacterium]|nr:cytochrome P450 [Kofleriaceae bacterium]
MPRSHPLDPPPQYRELAEQRPIFRVKTPRDQYAWVVTRHDDVRAVLLDKRFSSDPRSPGFPTYLTGDLPPPPGFFLQLDPPDQTRLRKLVNREFVISQMEKLRPRMQVILDGLIDRMIARGGPLDLVHELAYPMASTVICEMLNVPYEDHDVFVSLTDTVLDRSSTAEETARAATELMAYFDRLVTRRKQETGPADDILGRLIGNASDSDLGHTELVGLAALLLLSGYDTMAQVIGLGVLTLLLHPDQLAELRADPSLVPQAVEELLRYLSINHSGLPRAVLEDVEVGGQLIRAGEGVLVMINAANRDQTVFDRPDQFDIHRRGLDQHVAFGHGLHKCIGLTLARVELSTVFAGLFRRLPTLQLQRGIDELPFRHEMVLYGVRELPVSW